MGLPRISSVYPDSQNNGVEINSPQRLEFVFSKNTGPVILRTVTAL
jgi:hypothetical protein